MNYFYIFLYYHLYYLPSILFLLRIMAFLTQYFILTQNHGFS